MFVLQKNRITFFLLIELPHFSLHCFSFLYTTLYTTVATDTVPFTLQCANSAVRIFVASFDSGMTFKLFPASSLGSV